MKHFCSGHSLIAVKRGNILALCQAVWQCFGKKVTLNGLPAETNTKVFKEVVVRGLGSPISDIGPLPISLGPGH